MRRGYNKAFPRLNSPCIKLTLLAKKEFNKPAKNGNVKVMGKLVPCPGFNGKIQ